jgi:hypothetical protein
MIIVICIIRPTIIVPILMPTLCSLYFAEEMENGGSKGDVPEDANARKNPLLSADVDYYHLFSFSLDLGQIWSSKFSCFRGRLAMEDGIFCKPDCCEFVVQIALEHSQRRQGRRIPALDVLTSRFAPLPLRAPILVIRSFVPLSHIF